MFLTLEKRFDSSSSDDENGDRRNFTYQFYGNSLNFNKNQGFSKQIQVNIIRYKTVSDIKKLIALDLHIKDSQLTIENQSPQTQLTNLPYNYIFQITINNFCPNLDFYLPDGKIIQIKNGYQMTFDQIINSLQNEDTHYSRLCMINNFRMSVSGEELNQNDFPFYSSQTNTKIKIELVGNIATLNYGENKFTFSENENVKNATNLIQQSFNMHLSKANRDPYQRNVSNYKTVTILNDQNRNISNRNEVLKSFIRYTVHVDCNFIFNYLNGGNNTNLLIDYRSTAFDAQKQLAVQLCYANGGMIDNYNMNQNYRMRLYDDKLDPSACFCQDPFQRGVDKEKKRPQRVIDRKRNRHQRGNVKQNNYQNNDQQYIQLKPENIIIYDANQKKIEDLDKLLIDIQNDKMIFYYDVVFDESKIMKHKPKVDAHDKKLESDSLEDDLNKKPKPSPKLKPKVVSESDSDYEDLKHFKDNRKSPLKKLLPKKKFTEEEEDVEVENTKKISEFSEVKSTPPKPSMRKKIINMKPKIKPIDQDKKSSKDDDDCDEEDERASKRPKKLKEMLNVYFVFEETNVRKIKPFEKELPIQMTIADIKSMLSTDYDIDDKIQVKYKFKTTKVTIDNDMNLEDIKEDIIEKGPGYKKKNVLYIQLIPLKKVKSQPTIKKASNDKEEGETTDEFKMQVLSTSQVDEFKQQKELGKGSTSKVIKVNRIYALKIFNAEFCKKDDDEEEEDDKEEEKEKKTKKRKSDAGEEEEEEEEENEDEEEIEIDLDKMKLFRKEYDIINRLNHKNIIRAFGICFGDIKHRPSILLEYCPYTLDSVIKTLSKEKRIQIILEIIEGMKHVHAAGIIHRDLKPSNILLDKEKHVKLSDFGLSKIVNSEKLTQTLTDYVGTRPFMAPELIQGRTDYTNKIDVYAFGIVVYMIFTKGKYPKIKLFDVGLGKKAPIPNSISKKAREMISKCWTTEPDKRPTFDELGEFVLENRDEIYSE